MWLTVESKAQGQEPKNYSWIKIQPLTGEISQMFAKHNPLKSNHVHAYRVFGQTFMCPADERERELRSMIQIQPIPNRNSRRSLEQQPGRDFLAGRFDGTRFTRQRGPCASSPNKEALQGLYFPWIAQDYSPE